VQPHPARISAGGKVISMWSGSEVQPFDNNSGGHGFVSCLKWPQPSEAQLTSSHQYRFAPPQPPKQYVAAPPLVLLHVAGRAGTVMSGHRTVRFVATLAVPVLVSQTCGHFATNVTVPVPQPIGNTGG
jgi:hypothetical protein